MIIFVYNVACVHEPRGIFVPYIDKIRFHAVQMSLLHGWEVSERVRRLTQRPAKLWELHAPFANGNPVFFNCFLGKFNF